MTNDENEEEEEEAKQWVEHTPKIYTLWIWDKNVFKYAKMCKCDGFSRNILFACMRPNVSHRKMEIL